MRARTIDTQIKSLKDLVKRTQFATAGNLELQSHWAKYLCVVSSGLIENAIETLYIDFAKRIGSAPLASYVDATLSGVRNPDTDKILKIAKQFKENWAQELDSFINQEGRKEAINSIIGQRHKIAHGNGNQSVITVAALNSYLDKAIEVIEFIEAQCA